MAAIGTVSIDRTSLSLSPLVIDTEGFNVYSVDVAGLGRVGTTLRETFAAPSPWIHGQFRTSVVKDESSLVLVVRVQAGTTTDVQDAVHTLEAALFQFIYSATVTVDGVSKVWTAYPATIGAVDGLVGFERVTGHFEDLSISIPVYPVAVT